jgi:hypothetical protein
MPSCRHRLAKEIALILCRHIVGFSLTTASKRQSDAFRTIISYVGCLGFEQIY